MPFTLSICARGFFVISTVHAGDARLRARVDAAMDWHHMTIRRGCTAQVQKQSISWTFLFSLNTTFPASCMGFNGQVLSTPASLSFRFSHHFAFQHLVKSAPVFRQLTSLRHTPTLFRSVRGGFSDRFGTEYLRQCRVSQAVESRLAMVKASSGKHSRSEPRWLPLQSNIMCLNQCATRFGRP